IGPGETALRDHEMIVGVVIPERSLQRVTAFRKLSLYKGGFAVCSCAASLRLDAHGAIAEISVVMGGVAPTPCRLRSAESMLLGRVPSPELVKSASESWIGEAHPLRNNGWKLSAAAVLVARTMTSAFERAGR